MQQLAAASNKSQICLNMIQCQVTIQAYTWGKPVSSDTQNHAPSQVPSAHKSAARRPWSLEVHRHEFVLVGGRCCTMAPKQSPDRPDSSLRSLPQANGSTTMPAGAAVGSLRGAAQRALFSGGRQRPRCQSCSLAQEQPWDTLQMLCWDL